MTKKNNFIHFNVIHSFQSGSVCRQTLSVKKPRKVFL